MKERPPLEEGAVLASIVALFGSAATLFVPLMRELGDAPVFAAVAAVVAACVSPFFTPSVVRGSRAEAAVMGGLFGATVAVVGAGVVGFGIGVILSPLAMPVTVPCGIVWAAALRSRRRWLPDAWAARVSYGIALACAVVAVGVRLGPVTFPSGDGSCMRYPGAFVESIRWNGEGTYIGVATSSFADGSALHVVALPELSESIVLDVGAWSVGPSGETLFVRWASPGVVHWAAEPAFEPPRDPVLWLKHFDRAEVELGSVDGHILSAFTWTSGGVAAVDRPRGWDSDPIWVWVVVNGGEVSIRPISSVERESRGLPAAWWAEEQTVGTTAKVANGVIAYVPPDDSHTVCFDPR